MSPDVIQAVMPNCKDPDGWAAAFGAPIAKYLGGDLDRQAAFIAQIAHESLELTRLEENLRYAPERLMVVWKKRFPTIEIATKYANNSHGLADFVYANRMGNGDEASGDGWKYRGRGPIMATGKAQYQQLAVALNVPLVDCPDSLCTKIVGAQAACYLWMAMSLNPLADDKSDDDDNADFVSITRRINGGTVGLDARRKYWKRARAALGLKEV